MSGRVCVTGGAGFIGSHVAEAYLAAGWEVVIIDDLSTGFERNVPRGARLVVADIRSPEAHRVVAEGGFDLLNHQAAQLDVRVSVADPRRDADINLLGWINLLEAAGRGGVRRVVFASSGGVQYGEATTLPTPETAPKMPESPYGVSKVAGELYLRTLGALRGFETVALRYGNVYGPRQNPHGEAGVCAIFTARLSQGPALTVFGDGAQTRDFVFVRDVVAANLLASTRPLPPDTDVDARAFNVGTGRQVSVNALAGAIGAAMGVTPSVTHAPPRAGELQRSCLDCAKAQALLGWSPEWPLEDGLGELVRWYRASPA